MRTRNAPVRFGGSGCFVFRLFSFGVFPCVGFESGAMPRPPTLDAGMVVCSLPSWLWGTRWDTFLGVKSGWSARPPSAAKGPFCPRQPTVFIVQDLTGWSPVRRCGREPGGRVGARVRGRRGPGPSPAAGGRVGARALGAADGRGPWRSGALGQGLQRGRLGGDGSGFGPGGVSSLLARPSFLFAPASAAAAFVGRGDGPGALPVQPRVYSEHWVVWR